MQRAQEPLFFLFFHQLPFPILLWGLASGGRSVSGRCIALPSLEKPILEWRKRKPLLPLCQLFRGISQRSNAWSLKDTHLFRVGVGFHLFWVFTSLSKRHLWVLNTHYLIKVPKEPALDPAWQNTSAKLGSQQPCLVVGRGKHHSATKQSQWVDIRKRSFGLFFVTDCGVFCSVFQGILYTISF